MNTVKCILLWKQRNRRCMMNFQIKCKKKNSESSGRANKGSQRTCPGVSKTKKKQQREPVEHQKNRHDFCNDRCGLCRPYQRCKHCQVTDGHMEVPKFGVPVPSHLRSLERLAAGEAQRLKHSWERRETKSAPAPCRFCQEGILAHRNSCLPYSRRKSGRPGEDGGVFSDLARR